MGRWTDEEYHEYIAEQVAKHTLPDEAEEALASFSKKTPGREASFRYPFYEFVEGGVTYILKYHGGTRRNGPKLWSLKVSLTYPADLSEVALTCEITKSVMEKHGYSLYEGDA